MCVANLEYTCMFNERTEARLDSSVPLMQRNHCVCNEYLNLRATSIITTVELFGKYICGEFLSLVIIRLAYNYCH